jgi:hypothetical protein
MTEMSLPSFQATDHTYTMPERSFVVLLPQLLIIAVGLLVVVDGIVPQLEMAVTGGSLPLMPNYPALLIVGFGSMLLIKRRFQHSPLIPVVLLTLSYCLLEALYLQFYKGLSFTSVRRALEYFVFLELALIASVIPLKIKPRQVLAMFCVITFACLILSTAQFIMDSPIVRTESNDYAFHVESAHFLGKTRAFSLCGTALQAGIFYSFMGGIATSFCLRRGTRLFGLILLPLCGFGCYATYTRMVMIGFMLSVIAVAVISSVIHSRLGKLLPIFTFACAVLVVTQGLHTSGGAGRDDLANSSSLEQRVIDWGIYSGKFLAGSSTDILFGVGQASYTAYSGPDRPDNAAPLPVDNAYLLILLSSGITGLVILACVYWYLWIYLCKRITLRHSHLRAGITGIVAVVPFFCTITDPPNHIILLLLLVLSLEGEGIVTPDNAVLPPTIPALGVA